MLRFWKERRGRVLAWLAILATATSTTIIVAKDKGATRRRVILISLDGARPDVIEQYLRDGRLDKRSGLGRLAKHGVVADQNVTATPSVTAVSHIAIATGSTAVHNDITGNTFHAVVQPIGSSVSGFGAPIGGYQIPTPPGPPLPSLMPTAEPLWMQVRNAGGRVATATWPGGDGANISINASVVQAASPTRTVDYTVPFGAFGGVGARGFNLGAADFTAAPVPLVAQLAAAGRQSFSPVQATANPFETLYCPATAGNCGTAAVPGQVQYRLSAAALDTTNDGLTNYDMLVFFDANVGVQPGAFARPATGPAYVRAGGRSGLFYFQGSGNRVGTSFFVNRIGAGLSTVRFARYSANFIPRNAAVLADVDDINQNVGFWVAQPDFRIPQRVGSNFGPFSGFEAFSDEELEAIYQDQVVTFVDYQTQIGVRAIARHPEADLVMIYIEQPDGSGHQFTLTDARQPSDPFDPKSIAAGVHPDATGQDPAKVARYARYLEFAYQAASNAVENIIQAVGVHPGGEPLANIFVVSDHGMAPFHTAVNLLQILRNAGVCPALPAPCSQIGIRTTGPAANIYVNLQGRESGGTVAPAAYDGLVNSIATALRNAVDPNPSYNPEGQNLFTHVLTRPTLCGKPGFCTNDDIGQDTGDVLALMAEGYNFDGIQDRNGDGISDVFRLGDPAGAVNPYALPSFYGAHGHDSAASSMSAIFYAAGPDVKQGTKVRHMRNIDVAPTILDLMGLSPAPTMDGRSLVDILKR